MNDKNREFELKLELDENGIAGILTNTALSELATEPARQRHLSSTYFDTPDHRLHQAGISLRIREVDGDFVQTVKQGNGMQGGISNPVEIEAAIAGKTPDPDAIGDEEMRERIAELVDFSELRPVFQTDITRDEYQLALNGTHAELALDSGQLRSPRTVRPICEAELELKAGDMAGFAELAQKLFSNVTFRFGVASKAQKGYAQIDRHKAEPPAPAVAWRPELDVEDDVASGFAKISQSACDQILTNWAGFIDADDPEFAHQLRIGLRRLRSALTLFADAFDDETHADLGDELGEVGRLVGRLRNMDVMVADIVEPTTKSAPRMGHMANSMGRLEALIIEQCALERRRIKSELRLRRWNPLLLRIALLPHGGDWERKLRDNPAIAKYAFSALETRWKKVKRRAEKLEKLSDEKRHRLRKDLKILRYAIEFFSSIMPAEACRDYLRQLKALQDSFGYLNDVALANTLPQLLESDISGDPQLAEAVGFVLGWHDARADSELTDAAKRWNRLKKQPKLWD